MDNKLKLLKIIIFLLPILFITSCKVPPTTPKVERPSLNVIVLLDLSDRLILQDAQPSRDTALVKHICSEMANIIRDNNGVDRSKESIKIQIAHQDSIPYINLTTQFSDSLYFKMSKDVRGGIPAIRKILLGRFSRNLDQLYKKAVFSQDPKAYKGGNISRYFIQDLNNDIKRDSMTNNLMFILTDGYVVVGQENNFMLDVHNRFPELKVMVLEIAPRNQDYEIEQLQYSWDSWFANMAVKGYTLRNIGPTQEIKDDITKFLKGTLPLTVPGKIRPRDHEQQRQRHDVIPINNTKTDTTNKMKPLHVTNNTHTGSSEKSQEPPRPPLTRITTTLHFLNGDVYVGETLNGQPDGLGTLTFGSSRQIFNNDIHKQRADSGDMIINGTWNNGELQIGQLFNSKKGLKYTIIIGSV